jgi:hypothetical protein
MMSPVSQKPIKMGMAFVLLFTNHAYYYFFFFSVGWLAAPVIVHHHLTPNSKPVILET